MQGWLINAGGGSRTQRAVPCVHAGNCQKERITMNYRSFSDELKDMFGEKVYKLSLTSGCSCPNRDGTIGWGGCTFCSEGGSGDFAAPLLPLPEQIAIAKSRVRQKGAKRYLAYFQSFTNTYGDTQYLRELFTSAISFPEIVGLSVGTRPDCLEPDKISMLSELNKLKPVYVELGLQTIHEETARRINRGYQLDVFKDAYARLIKAGLRVVIHVILGLPGETREDMLDTVRYLAGLTPPPDGIKLQLLHILEGTQLAVEYRNTPFYIMSLEEYADLIIDCLRILPSKVTIHRLTGDGPKRLLIAPSWSADKKRVMNYLNQKIREADETGDGSLSHY